MSAIFKNILTELITLYIIFLYMTEMNKYRLRRHLKKYDVAYSIALFMLGVMVALALEARGVIS